MSKSVFRIGSQWVNLAFVQRFDIFPGSSWGRDDDEKRPRLYIHVISNAGFDITEQQAMDAGYKDIPALIEALTDAMDALA